MSDDLAAWLRAQVDDDETLAESDYDIMISARKVRDAAAEITRLRATISQIMTPGDNYKRLNAALATARREGMEEAAQKALIIASVLSSPSAQNALRSFADVIRAAAKEGSDE